ncbi:MAG: hypothetical protein K2J48_10260 [Muribaculaceae bacterium]|nr:hypothetical protein [Muribaculaceae bacterium]
MNINRKLNPDYYMSGSGERAWNTFLFGVLTGMAILGAGAIMAESEITFINIWIFLFLLLLAGLGLGRLFRRTVLCRAWSGMPEWVNMVFIAIVFTAITGGGILLVNSLCSDSGRMEEREVVVERKIIKTRHKTQTTGRHTYSSGAPYHVYYLELKFADGRKVEIQPPYKVYQKAEKGDTALIRVGRGALMMNVCDPKSLRLKHPPLKRKRFGFGHGNRRRKL